ncbi:MAG: DoxX family protein [Isosphaeraceae bacterium]
MIKVEREKTWNRVGKWVFAALFLSAGIGHLLAPKFYLKIMPPSLPFPLALVVLSGVIEIILGILLVVPAYSRLAAWGIIALLIAVFPANFYMYQHYELFSVPPLVLLLRLPMQGLLILWAFVYTRH